MTTRRFKAAEGRHVTMPQGLATGPGATTMRLEPGDSVDLDGDRCQAFQRFIAGRLRAGDLTEEAAEGELAVVTRDVPEIAAGRPMELPTAPKGASK